MKGIAVDIDGTITFSDRRIDCRAVEALRSIEVPVILATGNILCFARAAAKMIGTGGIVIAENGGAVSMGNDHAEFDSRYLDECERTFRILGETFGLERIDPGHRRTEIALRRNFDLEKAQEIIRLSGLEVELVDTGFAVHIKSIHINKGLGLRRIAKLMEVSPEDFAAMGDSPNDIELLRESGFGIAVGNAHPRVKSAAHLVTSGEYGAGVAEAIEYLKTRRLL